MPTTITLEELARAQDLDLGISDWEEISQADIQAFADATGDHQWIHTDVGRAATGPFGGTIAHGYLTLALVPRLVGELLHLSDASMGVNYGVERLRLTAPVPSGSRVRARATIAESSPRGDGLQYAVDVQIDVEGSERPALVGQMLFIAY